MKKILLYYPFQLQAQTSGSSVRPVKMIEAFEVFAKENQLELIKIIGNQKERASQLKKLYETVNPIDIEMCYMENVNIPLWLTDRDHIPKKPLLDINFFKYLKENKIPLGVFYRDIYWKFNELYKVNALIKPVLQRLFQLELNYYKKYADILFLPSLQMNNYVNFNRNKVVTLPPGGFDKITDNPVENKAVTAIYVGGVNPRYGVYDVLNALDTLNASENKIKLNLICREAEFFTHRDHFQPYIDKPWLVINHASSAELHEYYTQSDFGIIPLKKDVYNNFAVAVKLFEYMSYGLPIIATDCNAQKEIIQEDDLGLVVNDNADAIAEGLKEMLSVETRLKYRNNVIKALRTKHLWLHRAEKVYNTLLGIGENR